MTLIGIFIALMLEFSLSHVQEWREHHWFRSYIQWLHRVFGSAYIWSSRWLLLPLLAPVLITVALIQSYIHQHDLIILELIFGVLVLLLCLGPRDLGEEVASYHRARADGDEAACKNIETDLCAGPMRLSVRNGDGHQRSLIRGILLQGHERYFSVLVWFFILGPIGAVAYRLVSSMPGILYRIGAGFKARMLAQRFHGTLAWIPLHITVLLFALAGDSRAVFNIGTKQYPDRSELDGQWRLLAQAGQAAVQDDLNDEVEHDLDIAMSLLKQVLMLLLGIFALFTIGGWLA